MNLIHQDLKCIIVGCKHGKRTVINERVHQSSCLHQSHQNRIIIKRGRNLHYTVKQRDEHSINHMRHTILRLDIAHNHVIHIVLIINGTYAIHFKSETRHIIVHIDRHALLVGFQRHIRLSVEVRDQQILIDGVIPNHIRENRQTNQIIDINQQLIHEFLKRIIIRRKHGNRRTSTQLVH